MKLSRRDLVESAAMRRGGVRGLLKPVVALCARGSRAEVVYFWFR